MTELVLRDQSAIQNAIAKINKTSSALGRAAEHLGSAMRGSYLKLVEAVENADVPKIGEIVDRIRNSDLVVGIASKFHHLREKAVELRDVLAPWAKVIGGLVVGVGAFFLASDLSFLLAVILVIGGFLYAVTNALKILSAKGRGMN